MRLRRISLIRNKQISAKRRSWSDRDFFENENSFKLSQWRISIDDNKRRLLKELCCCSTNDK